MAGKLSVWGSRAQHRAWDKVDQESPNEQRNSESRMPRGWVWETGTVNLRTTTAAADVLGLTSALTGGSRYLIAGDWGAQW